MLQCAWVIVVAKALRALQIMLVKYFKLPDILEAPSFPKSFGNQSFHHSYSQVKNMTY